MVDIHCHILPGLDDGAAEDYTSKEMAAMAAADGITHIVATPHSNYRFTFDPELNRRKCAELQNAIGQSPRLLLGCDFHLSYENLEAVQVRPADFTINGLQYLLVEFSDTSIPVGMDKIFADLNNRQLVPIITHPERNPLLRENLAQIQNWIRAGCCVQVTAGALLDRFGKRSLHAAQQMLDRKMVHFLASDAHDTSFRPPLLSEARQVLAANHGEEVACALTQENPLAVIEGRALPWKPEPVATRERKWFSAHR